MRWTDLLGLPVAALGQQKSRTILTTLGVVFGSFVLAASLSINQGVQDTIRRESQRHDMMRRIGVRPDYSIAESEADRDDREIAGNMSEERRARIQQALRSQKTNSRARKPKLPLTPDTLRTLAALEHVESVVPVVGQSGTVVIEHRPRGASVASARPEDAASRARLLAGRFFDSPTERAAVVSELLVYQCGLLDDRDIDGVLGKTLRLELFSRGQSGGLGVSYNKADGAEATSEELSAVDEIRRQLPELLEFFNLSKAEVEMLRKGISGSGATVDEYVAELPIVGVLRLPTELELKGPRDPLRVNADVLLPYQTASDLYFQSPRQNAAGLDNAVVFVDGEENVPAVFERIKGMGLAANAALEYIERQRLLYSLIFGGMTCVAAVALLVAALGIANTMLMSVLERTREIGIMKAVGASNGQLSTIFVVEGALIGLVGGGLGMLLAWGASFPGDEWVRSHVSSDVQVYLTEPIFVFPSWLTGTVLLFAVLVTTIAAVYPARRAAQVDPVTALRHE
jgi:putative ABC transport system permease protein